MEDRQPILISSACDPLNKAQNIALADGVWREEASGFSRAFLFFGEDEVEQARATWRDLSGRHEIQRRFWKRDEAGRWTQAA
jgi:DNA polymerase-3 subunit chi